MNVHVGCLKVKLYQWSSFTPQCSLKSDQAMVKGGGVTKVFQSPISTVLKNCGNCTRKSCVVTFVLSGTDGVTSPSNYLFLSSPMDAEGLQKPNITVRIIMNLLHSMSKCYPHHSSHTHLNYLHTFIHILFVCAVLCAGYWEEDHGESLLLFTCAVCMAGCSRYSWCL